MSLWRLPPVVIIHLKRFQFTQHMRRKLRDFVDFPVEGLDLSRIMAADTVEANKAAGDEGIKNSDGEGDPAATAHEDPSDVEESAAPLNQDNGRSEMLYDLYGVVHHQGALSGGHYVASLKSEDGQWRLFNDAQVYEIHSRDVVDSSAYILFYIRRDVKKLTLEDFWNTTPAREGEGLTEEEMDKLIRDRSERCVIS
jgi:ubiquitin carboxyl-terminal hydrolase 4/11